MYNMPAPAWTRCRGPGPARADAASVSGTFRRGTSTSGRGSDFFSSPAPDTAGAGSALGLRRHRPNGQWRLFVMNDGWHAGGWLTDWSLHLSTTGPGLSSRDATGHHTRFDRRDRPHGPVRHPRTPVTTAPAWHRRLDPGHVLRGDAPASLTAAPCDWCARTAPRRACRGDLRRAPAPWCSTLPRPPHHTTYRVVRHDRPGPRRQPLDRTPRGPEGSRSAGPSDPVTGSPRPTSSELRLVEGGAVHHLAGRRRDGRARPRCRGPAEPPPRQRRPAGGPRCRTWCGASPRGGRRRSRRPPGRRRPRR
jgi:hypothetical protein